MQQARRLTIGRGEAAAPRPLRAVGAPAEPVPVPEPPQAHAVEAASAPSPAPAADLHLVHHRLVALERLTALFERGALSADEFAAEKALVLRVPAEELLLSHEPALPQRGPSLLGRLFQPKLLVAGLVAGLALSAWVQPRELEALLRAFG